MFTLRYRGLGIGKKLDAWLKNFALSRDCEAIELNCYIKNEKGRNFQSNQLKEKFQHNHQVT